MSKDIYESPGFREVRRFFAILFLLWVLRNFHCHIITAFAGFRNQV